MRTASGFSIRIAALGLLLGSAAAALAAPPPPAPSREERDKMAQIHEQMAACLRSERSIEECRTEMMKSCHAALGRNGCRMMQRHGMMRHGMMDGGGRRMMPPPGPPPAAPTPPPAPPPASPPPPR